MRTGHQIEESPIAAYVAARLCAAGLLFIAIADLPYDYYTLMRFVVCVVGGYASYVSYRGGEAFWTCTFGAIALLFNPFAPVRLERETWAILDIGGGGVFLASGARDLAKHMAAAKNRRNVERLAEKAREARFLVDQERRAAEATVARQQAASEAERLRKWQERAYKR